MERDTVTKAFEFAVAHVGHDKDTGGIWNAYIKFLLQVRFWCNFASVNLGADFVLLGVSVYLGRTMTRRRLLD